MIMTLFKTGCYFASSAVMIPLRTGVVRDIRIMVYAKVMRLPMSFFSEERKGDIIARMSGSHPTFLPVATSYRSTCSAPPKTGVSVFVLPHPSANPFPATGSVEACEPDSS